MKMLVINGHDFTNNIVMSSHKINNIPKYEEWTDSNYTVHREITRKQVEGSLTLKFYSIADYELFLSSVKKETVSDGSTLITVYINNERTTRNIYTFLEFTPENNLPILGMKDDNGFEVKITER